MPWNRRELLRTGLSSTLASGLALATAGCRKTEKSAREVGTATGQTSPGSLNTYDNLPVRVNNPLKLKAWHAPAVRTRFGEGYKPSLGLLPDGEAIMVWLQTVNLPGNKYTERTPLWRSNDGGVTWSGGAIIQDMFGREHWLTCTSEGVLLTTCHLLANDVNNQAGYTQSYLHRSTDRGRTWQRTLITVEGFPEKNFRDLTRNVVELPDNTLLLGVAVYETDGAFLWSSKDGGLTWDKSLKVKAGEFQFGQYSLFTESWIHRSTSGKLHNFIRSGPESRMYRMNDTRPIPQADYDTGDRILHCQPTDGGRIWKKLRTEGEYGMMYPRVLRLRDGRVMMTYTMRGINYPLGLRAVFSYDDGETRDWNHDQVVIDGKGAWGGYQGGGFGNTLELPDGTLLSAYSYRDYSDPDPAKSHSK